jgi:hypothetical protein
LPTSRKGNKSFILFIDEKTRAIIGHAIKTKDQAPEKIEAAIQEFERMDRKHKVHKLRSDNAKELISKKVQAMLLKRSIVPETSAPYSPNQNGLVERYNRTVLEMIRCLLHQANYPGNLWEDAFEVALYILNRRVNAHTGRIPLEDLTGEKVDLSGMRAFGAEARVLIVPTTGKKLSKLAPRTRKAFFLGYVGDSHGTYKFWDPKERKVFMSKDATFDENNVIRTSWPAKGKDPLLQAAVSQNPFAILQEKPMRNGQEAQQDNDEVDSEEEEEDNNEEEEDDDLLEQRQEDAEEPKEADELERQEERQDEEDGQDELISQEEKELLSDSEESEAPIQENQNQQDSPVARQRPRRVRQLNSTLRDSVVIGSKSQNFTVGKERNKAKPKPKAHAAEAVDEDNPRAEDVYQNEQWQAAMNEEYASLMKNNTWKLVDLPPGRTVVDNKWVLKVKRKPDNSVDRYKARLVAKGFTQRPGQDYSDTFAPVAKISSLKLIVAMSGPLKLKLKHLDVKTAFLQGELDEVIYMRQPQYFEKDDERVCELLKPIYGLKQSSRCWNKRAHKTLTKIGFQRTRSDYCVYVLRRGKELAILLCWVDDLLLACNSATLEQELTTKLAAELEIRDLGALNYFLGFEFSETPQGYTMKQTKYAKDLLEKARMSDCKPVPTPMEGGMHYTRRQPNEQQAEATTYRSVVGGLQYLCHTRPDIQFAVGVVSRFVSDPSVLHWQAVKRILRYIQGTQEWGLRFSREGSGVVSGYSDADWAGDLSDRKSTSGYAFFFNGALVSAASRKQTTVALSTAEAEYVALAAATQEALWLRSLLGELGFAQEKPTLVLQDNQSAMAIAKNPEMHARTKHIDIRHHFVRDCVENKQIYLEFCPSEKMVADILTKPLTKAVFQELREQLGVCS